MGLETLFLGWFWECFNDVNQKKYLLFTFVGLFENEIITRDKIFFS